MDEKMAGNLVDLMADESVLMTDNAMVARMDVAKAESTAWRLV